MIDWMAARMISIGGAVVMAVTVWELTREEREYIAKLFRGAK
jgi:hypothetical protein